MLSFNTYQARAHKTAVYPQEWGVLYSLMGLGGENGEVMEKVKKAMRSGDMYIDANGRVANPSPEVIDAIKKELGDKLWYMAEVCTVLGLTLADVAQENIDKLQSRSLRGVLIGEGDNR